MHHLEKPNFFVIGLGICLSFFFLLMGISTGRELPPENITYIKSSISYIELMPGAARNSKILEFKLKGSNQTYTYNSYFNQQENIADELKDSSSVVVGHIDGKLWFLEIDGNVRLSTNDALKTRLNRELMSYIGFLIFSCITFYFIKKRIDTNRTNWIR